MADKEFAEQVQTEEITVFWSVMVTKNENGIIGDSIYYEEEFTCFDKAMNAFESGKKIAAEKYESEYKSTRFLPTGPDVDDFVVNITEFNVPLCDLENFKKTFNETGDKWDAINEWGSAGCSHEYYYTSADYIRDKYMDKLKFYLPLAFQRKSFKFHPWEIGEDTTEKYRFQIMELIGLPNDIDEFINEAINETAEYLSFRQN